MIKVPRSQAVICGIDQTLKEAQELTARKVIRDKGGFKRDCVELGAIA